MYVLHAPTDDARTCIEEEKLPAAVKHVPTAVRVYLLRLPCARVPSDVRAHLLHILLFLQMNVRTHRT